MERQQQKKRDFCGQIKRYKSWKRQGMAGNSRNIRQGKTRQRDKASQETAERQGERQVRDRTGQERDRTGQETLQKQGIVSRDETGKN